MTTKRRHVMKLFAVTAVLASSGCETAPTSKPAPAPTPVVAPKPALMPAPAPAPTTQTVRKLPNGRPACGNVSYKGPPPPSVGAPKDCVP